MPSSSEVLTWYRWEELEDKSPQGQWTYFERVKGSEAPPTESK